MTWEGDNVATKSIYKNVNIKSRPQCRNLITALERAHKYRGEEVTISKMVREVKKEDIKQLFGQK